MEFAASPDLNSAFRFLAWSMAFATAIVTAHYARRTSGHFVPAVTLWGATIYHVGLGLHQMYYWSIWRSRGDADVDLTEMLLSVRHFTSACLVIMVIGGVMMMQPLLRHYAGQYWPFAGVLGVSILWAIGYGDARWL